MRNVAEMLDKVREVRSLASDNALAAFLKVTRQAVSNWRTGRAYPDEVTCARIADAAGVPVTRVLGVVGEARAISSEAKAVWRRVATAAAVPYLLGAALLSSGAQEAVAGDITGTVYTLCAMVFVLALGYVKYLRFHGAEIAARSSHAAAPVCDPRASPQRLR